MTKTPSDRPAARGFTLMEVLVVLGILGIFMVVSYPSILNTMATRNLDNATREVQTFLQQTKLQAVSARIDHRVRFYQREGTIWSYEMERFQEDGTWVRVQRIPAKTISTRFNVTITLPIDTTTGDPVARFSSLGMFPDFTVGQNSVTLQSPKLQGLGQPDERVLSMFMGGSIQYVRQ
ncbi:MAG TPA: prepilin-type N-terminal cleavage/methylation domain-containing protein [Candidatus Aminicenantes bacterium]|nr:prepilin-type N-terminal cleavage/methylation domain-containing protein [Candidatus Aminicenantes bacterium]HDT13591.1 prepilin-type N-terminal cleavage/methylation domain-containing protein [Candidatus Aminicenantes bacterium]